MGHVSADGGPGTDTMASRVFTFSSGALDRGINAGFAACAELRRLLLSPLRRTRRGRD
jgi:hypothetical protein